MPESLIANALPNRQRSRRIFSRLSAHYTLPDHFLDHGTPFQLLIATLLSAQCTDARVNQVTPSLFGQWPTPRDMAKAVLSDITLTIRSVNYYRTKAKNIQTISQTLVKQYRSRVPESMDRLLALPGVGRKTAHVVRTQAFGKIGITVDTHVARVSRRLNLTSHHQPNYIERDLMMVWPGDIWHPFSMALILHGRLVCRSRSPSCDHCCLEDECPSRYEETVAGR